jgi:VWFA-related protein
VKETPVFLASLALAFLPLLGQGEMKEYFLHATFTGYDGRPLRSLRPEEIAVSLGTQELEITSVTGPEEPFDIALVLDVSPSTEANIDSIRRATSDFVSFFPPQNRFLVLTFDVEVYVDCDWTTDRKKIDEAIWEFGLHKPGGSTILYEAVTMAVQQKLAERKPRVAMVLFTDGVDTGSKAVKDRESIEFMKTAAVVPYVIQYFDLAHAWRLHFPAPERPDVTNLPPAGGGGPRGPIFVGRGERDMAEYRVERMRQNATTYLRGLADAGGGVLYSLAGLDELPKAYEKIAIELLDVHTIHFRAPGPPPEGRRRVAVTCTRPDVVVRVRPPGYVAR